MTRSAVVSVQRSAFPSESNMDSFLSLGAYTRANTKIRLYGCERAREYMIFQNSFLWFRFWYTIHTYPYTLGHIALFCHKGVHACNNHCRLTMSNSVNVRSQVSAASRLHEPEQVTVVPLSSFDCLSRIGAVLRLWFSDSLADMQEFLLRLSCDVAHKHSWLLFMFILFSFPRAIFFRSVSFLYITSHDNSLNPSCLRPAGKRGNIGAGLSGQLLVSIVR